MVIWAGGPLWTSAHRSIACRMLRVACCVWHARCVLRVVCCVLCVATKCEVKWFDSILSLRIHVAIHTCYKSCKFNLHDFIKYYNKIIIFWILCCLSRFTRSITLSFISSFCFNTPIDLWRRRLNGWMYWLWFQLEPHRYAMLVAVGVILSFASAYTMPRQ